MQYVKAKRMNMVTGENIKNKNYTIQSRNEDRFHLNTASKNQDKSIKNCSKKVFYTVEEPPKRFYDANSYTLCYKHLTLNFTNNNKHDS